jgi:hypothetical protein
MPPRRVSTSKIVRYVVCDPDVASSTSSATGTKPDRRAAGRRAAPRRRTRGRRTGRRREPRSPSRPAARAGAMLRRWSPLAPDRAASSSGHAGTSRRLRKHAFAIRRDGRGGRTCGSGSCPRGRRRRGSGPSSPTRLRRRLPPAAEEHFATARAGPTMLAVQLTAKLNPARRALFLSRPSGRAAPKPATTKRRSPRALPDSRVLVAVISDTHLPAAPGAPKECERRLREAISSSTPATTPPSPRSRRCARSDRRSTPCTERG